jgi:hypothetical protein
MTFRALSRGYVLALVCGAASLLMARGQGQPPATPSTNGMSIPAQGTPPPKDRLMDLEDQLSKALESISPKGMLDAKPEPQYQPPPLPVIPNRRLKEEREKRKNWMFQDSDNWLRDSSTPDWLNPSDTKDGKKKNDLDLFYERLNQQRSLLNQKARLNPDDLTPLSGPSFGSDDSNSAKSDKLPDKIKGPADRLRDLLGFTPSTVTAPRNTVSDLFTPQQNILTPDQVEAHKNLMDQYRRILAGTPPAMSMTPLNSTAATGNPQVPSLPGATPHSTLFTPGMVGSIYNPTIMPDRNATVLNQWNPLYAPPKVEPPKPPPVIEQPIEAPRRKF